MRVRTKICGITREEDALLAAKLGADAIGLIFTATSPRQVSLQRAVQIREHLPALTSVFALFADDTEAWVAEVAEVLSPDYLQFHGDEDDDFCKRFARPFFKAIAMGSADQQNLKPPTIDFPSAAGLIFDAHAPGQRGGLGKTFEWSRLVPEHRPWLLAGGLNPDNIAAAIHQTHPWGVDVASGVERAPGIKDARHMARFFSEVLRAEVELSD